MEDGARGGTRKGTLAFLSWRGAGDGGTVGLVAGGSSSVCLGAWEGVVVRWFLLVFLFVFQGAAAMDYDAQVRELGERYPRDTQENRDIGRFFIVLFDWKSYQRTVRPLVSAESFLVLDSVASGIVDVVTDAMQTRNRAIASACSTWKAGDISDRDAAYVIIWAFGLPWRAVASAREAAFSQLEPFDRVAFQVSVIDRLKRWESLLPCPQSVEFAAEVVQLKDYPAREYVQGVCDQYEGKENASYELVRGGSKSGNTGFAYRSIREVEQ